MHNVVPTLDYINKSQQIQNPLKLYFQLDIVHITFWEKVFTYSFHQMLKDVNNSRSLRTEINK